MCAQHALNALLQGSYFTAVDLASIAQELDEKERINMAEAGMESQEYKEFIAVSKNPRNLGEMSEMREKCLKSGEKSPKLVIKIGNQLSNHYS